MPIEVKMAKLSPTMESGKLVHWLVKVGDKVAEGDALAEVETDKAVMPMEAFDEGIVAVLKAREGEEIAPGQTVLVLAARGEDPKQVAEQYAGRAVTPEPAPAVPARAGRRAAAAPGAADGPKRTGPGPAETAAPNGGRVRSTPLARKIAEAAGIDLSVVPGSGPGGRVIREDVEAFLQGRSPARSPRAPAPVPAPAAAPAPRPEPTPPARPQPQPPAAEPRRIPHSRMRKTIADRMLQAKRTAPEIHLTVEVRMDQVLAARQRLNQLLEPEQLKLSIGDFVTKAVAAALRRHPALNASFEEDAIVQHADVNLGIAVALDGGLIVPVLHHADRLGLREIRLETQALAEAARQQKLTSKQLTGATFTISNLGMYGIKQFDAILNLPEVGILAVGATQPRPVVAGDKLVVGQVMTLTLTADHRAVDGATAAAFLRTLQDLLEEPAVLLL